MRTGLRKATLSRRPLEVPIRPAVRALMLYLAVQTLVLCGVFLLLSGFFAQWDGHAVGVRPYTGANATVYQVLIVEEGKNTIERNMSALAIDGLNLPLNDVGVAPNTLPTTAAATKKSRFQLSYLVQRPAIEAEDVGTWKSYPTTTPQALGAVVLMWLMSLGIRNMIYAGSPLSIQPRAVALPKGQAQAGVAANPGKLRSRKTVPDRRPSRGPRR